MTEMSDLQKAMQRWREAFNEQSNYIENNDILDCGCYLRWLELRQRQDKARAEVDMLVDICRKNC